MYCGHKDQEGHDTWVEFKATNAKSRRQLKTGDEKTKGSKTDNASLPSNKDKALKLNPGLCIVLMTEAGLSDSQFDETWKLHGPEN
jgi:hypothetical protein